MAFPRVKATRCAQKHSPPTLLLTLLWLACIALKPLAWFYSSFFLLPLLCERQYTYGMHKAYIGSIIT